MFPFDYLYSITLADLLFYYLLLLAFVFVFSYVVTPKRKITNYKNKHVLITGGSSGLGKGTAIQLAKLGANITIIARNVAKLEEAKADIEVTSFKTRYSIQMIHSLF